MATPAMWLAHLVALLNATAAVLLVIGRIKIARGDRHAHHQVMTAAVAISVLFLIAYVAHHILVPLFAFRGQGWIVPVYFTFLASHVILAITVTPLVAMVYLRARAGDYARHKALARWVYPVWLYVSVTGIIVYLMLYYVFTGDG